MTPEGGGRCALEVSVGVGAHLEEIVGEHAQLWKALNSEAYFKIDPVVTGVVKGLYYLMNLLGMSESLTQTYSYRSRGVQR